jgi:pimeloyl-ACP methyl ester carboxylesterase
MASDYDARLLRRFDVRDRLHEIRAPTLFLASDHDHLVPAIAQARYMTERVPRSVMRILQGHGHICLIARISTYATSSLEWLDVPPCVDRVASR